MLGLFNDVGMPYDLSMFRRAMGGRFAEAPKPQFAHSNYWYVSARMPELLSLKCHILATLYLKHIAKY